MKTLLKIAVALTSILLFVTAIKAQTPKQLQNLPAFKMRALMESMHKAHTHGKLNSKNCSPNAPCLKAQTTLGGSNYDQGAKIIQTRDGGFAVCGLTFSDDGDFHPVDTINGNAYVAKYNKSQHLEWAKTYGGSSFDAFDDMIQTYDGGYAIVGQTNSNDGDVKSNHGNSDVWILKLSAAGNIEWTKTYGGTGDDFGNAIVQNFYGGYAVAGVTNSNDGDIKGNHNTDGNFDGLFMQVGAAGNLLSQNCYGGSDFDGLFSMVASGFGTYILEGATSSVDGDVSGNHGGGDAWVVKVNSLGKIVWQRPVGGSNYEDGGLSEITKTIDNNVVINGYSYSSDGDIHAQPQDTLASFLIKLNSKTGNIIWSKSYANPKYRAGYGVFATRDGGTVETASVTPNGDASTFDVLISKFDKNGNEEWYKQLGGSDFDAGIDGYENFNGDLNILCESNSLDGDVKGVHPGNTDEWIIKLGPCGEFEDTNTPVSLSETNKIISNNSTSSLSVYPNPVYNATTISFSLAQSQQVSLQVFDVSGRLIKILANENMQPGNHQLIWNTTNNNGATVASGIYFLKLQAGSVVQTKKIAVVQ